MVQWFRRPKDVGFQELVTEVRELTGKEVSAVRTSVGIATNFNDVYYLMRFLDTLRDRSVADIGVADDPLHHRDSA